MLLELSELQSFQSSCNLRSSPKRFPLDVYLWPNLTRHVANFCEDYTNYQPENHICHRYIKGTSFFTDTYLLHEFRQFSQSHFDQDVTLEVRFFFVRLSYKSNQALFKDYAGNHVRLLRLFLLFYYLLLSILSHKNA